MRFLFRDNIAGASTVHGQGEIPTGQTKTETASTAATPAELELDLGGEYGKVKATPDQIREWKLAADRKTTNQDRFFTKKSQELASQIKDISSLKESVATLTTMLQSQKAQGTQTSQAVTQLEGANGEIDPDKVADFLVNKVLDKVNPRLKDVDDLKKNFSAQSAEKKQQAFDSATYSIVGKSQLEQEDKQLFLDKFIGRHFHEIEDMPIEDTMDESTGQEKLGYKSLLKQEFDAFEKMLKDRGLLKNKNTAAAITDKNKKLGTDHKGASGLTTGTEDGKGKAKKSDAQISRDRVQRLSQILKERLKV